jgi:hypothetical protein
MDEDRKAEGFPVLNSWLAALRRHWRSGARAARAAFRFWTLQVRVLAAGKGGFVALANRARRLRLGQTFTIAAGIEAFDFRRFGRGRWLGMGHAGRTSGPCSRLLTAARY